MNAIATSGILSGVTSPDLLQYLPWIAVLGLCALLILSRIIDAAIAWKLIGGQDRALARQQMQTPFASAPPAHAAPPPAAQATAPPASPPASPPPPTQTLPAPDAPPPSTDPFASAPAWFKWALHEIGTAEIGSTNDGPAIARYRALAKCGSPGDPWCAIFANAALESVSVPGTKSPSSQSFRTDPDFVQISSPVLGAIAVFWRGSQSSGLGHVGFYRGELGGSVWVLGGNESNMVQIEALPKSSGTFGLVGYWWPKSVALPKGGPVVMPQGSPTHVTTPPDGTSSSASALPTAVNTGITATVFASADDSKVSRTSAYTGQSIDAAKPGVALPFHFPGARPQVVVTAAGKSVTCDIVDVGPWNTHDPYWQTGARPQAESGRDMIGRTTNHAGIDLTPAAAAAIGIDGKGVVDWKFLTT